MAIYYTNASGKILTLNNKVLIKATTLPDSYEYRGEVGESVELDLGNNKKVLLVCDTQECPHVFSADFSLAVLADGYQWGTYRLSEHYMQEDIYLYDLGENYGWGDQHPYDYIVNNFDPIALLQWNVDSGYIYITRY